MGPIPYPVCLACAIVALSLGVAANRAMAVSSQSDSISYSADIVPILAHRCFRCHGPDEKERHADLRLDESTSALRELESGARAIVPGNLAASAVWQRITSDDPDQVMPPPGQGEQLNAAQQARIAQWIESGATFDKHWSFRPIERPAIPSISDTSIDSPVDAFVHAERQRHRLIPNEEADLSTLIRRVYLDVTGLPPTSEEVSAALSDSHHDRYARAVDRILASPSFGERWARVWLDLARYADSAGYAQDPLRSIWKYRDWVIEAFNSNQPLDEFTRDQLAGDLLPNPTERQLIATAFHRNTMTNSEGGTDDEEFRNAAIVDRVNTTMQVWMGLTMGCAQCHSHKYDPISQKEYYQIFAVFNNTADADRGDEAPVLTTYSAAQELERNRLEREIALAEQQLAALERSEPTAVAAVEGPLLTQYVRVQLTADDQYLSLAEVETWIGEANVALQGSASQVNVAFDGEAQRAIDGNRDGQYHAANSTTHTDKTDQAWWEVDLGSGFALDEVRIFNRTDGVGDRLQQFHVIGLDPTRHPLWHHFVESPPSPSVSLPLPHTGSDVNDAARERLGALRLADSPGVAAARVTLAQLTEQRDAITGVTTPIMRELTGEARRVTRVQVRGNFKTLGEEVTADTPAAFPRLATLDHADRGGPSRRDIAEWLTDRRNPLTARVFANRVWEHLFGIGLVETSEDFGLQGTPPSHPALLDYLAVELIENGWDVKHLIRTIVLSSTYRLSTDATDEQMRIDPRNRWYARGPRFRLSAEMLRDQALAVSGLLSRTLYGRSVNPPQPKLGLRAAFGGSTDWEDSVGSDRYRRGLYTHWRRTSPYPSMVTFDAPSREFCTIRRITTNTPLQALVTLNDPAFIEAAQQLGRDTAHSRARSDEERCEFLFRRCLVRSPRRAETAALVELYRDMLDHYRTDLPAAEQMATEPLGPAETSDDIAELAAWTVVGNVVMNLDEFLARR